MCAIQVESDDDVGFNVKELREFLSGLDGDLPVTVCIIREGTDGGERMERPLEATGTDGDEVSLTCFAT